MSNEQRQFHIGAQNDMLYIISGRAPALNNDYPVHDADRTCVAKIHDEAEAKRLVGLQAELLKKDEELLAFKKALRKQLDVDEDEFVNDDELLGIVRTFVVGCERLRKNNETQGLTVFAKDASIGHLGDLVDELRAEIARLKSENEPTTDIPDEREDPCHPDYVGDLELPQPKKPAYTLEQMQNDILHDVADLADEAGMDEVAEELRKQAGEDSRQPTSSEQS